MRLRHRWDEPCIPTAHWLDTEHVQVTADGRIMQITCFQFSARNIRRIKAGYVCARCFCPHEQAFPVTCRACRFPMAREQASFVARNFRGNVRDGGDPAAEEDQRARIAEAREKWALEAQGLKKQGSILVPRGIN